MRLFSGRKRIEEQTSDFAAITVDLIKHKLLDHPPVEGMSLGVLDDDGREALRITISAKRCDGEILAGVFSNGEYYVTVCTEELVTFPKEMNRARVLEEINAFNRKLIMMTFALVDDDMPHLRVKTSFMCDDPERTSDQVVFFIGMLEEYLAEAYTTFSGIAVGR